MVEERVLSEELAATMDASAELLPWLPELFIGQEDLGVRAKDALALLSVVDLPAGGSVLDLGCGKGAALIAVVERYGCSGVGLDGVQPFIEHASERSTSLGLDGRVRFLCEDVRAAPGLRGSHELVMLLALGPIFGDTRETMGELRSWVRPGGYVLLAEAYLPNDLAADDPHWEFGLSLDELVEELTHHGDELVAELVYDTPEYRHWCSEVSAELQERAREMGRDEPEVAEALERFAQRQRDETEADEGAFVGSLFLLRRADS